MMSLATEIADSPVEMATGPWTVAPELRVTNRHLNRLVTASGPFAPPANVQDTDVKLPQTYSSFSWNARPVTVALPPAMEMAVIAPPVGSQELPPAARYAV